MEKISYKLEIFEGPLDLLLYLISKNKLNIEDIPISQLLAQYMEQIERLKNAQLDVASEFLEMAARLVYIKSVSLLPKHEEAEQLKRELTGQLLEYQACKEIAQKLDQKGRSIDLFQRLPTEFEVDLTYACRHEPGALLAAYLNAAGRGKRKIPPPVSAFSGIVSQKIISVSSKVIFVLRKLWGGKRTTFGALIAGAADRSELVATFLAVLELIKGNRVMVVGGNRGENIELMADGNKRWK